jgi:hypothetical protein
MPAPEVTPLVDIVGILHGSSSLEVLLADRNEMNVAFLFPFWLLYTVTIS